MYTQINCPRCGTPYQAEIHQIIDVGQNPNLKYQLMNGRLNVAICPKCNAGGQISTPMLYHDPEHSLFMVFVPPEANLDHMAREQLIGQLARQAMEAVPQEQRRAYMFQPQNVLTMQGFMEKVLETEGITKEMIQAQTKKTELLQTLARADRDVVDHLLKERGNEVDEEFFSMLQAYIDTASQTNDDKQLLPLLNLRAKLMTDTAVGRRLEQQQLALHKLNQDAKNEGGVTSALLLKHVLANQSQPDIVEGLAVAAQRAMDYQFFQLLTEEIEGHQKTGNKLAVKRLSELRTRLLDIQAALRQQSAQIEAELNKTVNALLAAEDKETAVIENLENGRIDDMFMQYLGARIAQADRQGQNAELQALSQIQTLIASQIEGQMPPEIMLLNDLLEVETETEQSQILDENQDMLSPDLVKMIEMVTERVSEDGQEALNGRLAQIKQLIQARL